MTNDPSDTSNNNKINKKILIIITALAVVFGIALLVLQFHDPTKKLEENVPGMDKKNAKADKKSTEVVKIGEKFQRFSEFESPLNGTWPQFRGAHLDNILTTNILLNENWEAKPPKIEWSVELGEGHSGAAIYGGLAYVLDYDEKEKADALRCFSLATGNEVWRRWYKVRLKRNHGRSRTVPSITNKFILTIGPRCHVMCLDRLTANVIWSLDLEKKYETETPFWYTGQCPIIENDIAIIAPGGKSLLIAVDCNTGKIVWETPNPKQWKMSHASVLPVTISGKKMYVYPAIGGICGISAEGDDAGSILWEYAIWTPSVIAPTAVYIGKQKILFSAGYGAGSIILKIDKQGNKFDAKLIQKLNPSEGIASEQQTAILYKNLIYCIQPKDGGALRNQFVCFNPDDCSKPVWSSGKTSRFGLGPYFAINDKFLILNDDGTLTMIKTSEKEYSQITQKKFFDGQDSWAPLAFADGYLLLRDSKKMFCINLKQ